MKLNCTELMKSLNLMKLNCTELKKSPNPMKLNCICDKMWETTAGFGLKISDLVFQINFDKILKSLIKDFKVLT